MSFVEGIGDEVLGFSAFILLLLLFATISLFRTQNSSANLTTVRPVPTESTHYNVEHPSNSPASRDSGTVNDAQENTVTETESVKNSISPDPDADKSGVAAEVGKNTSSAEATDVKETAATPSCDASTLGTSASAPEMERLNPGEIRVRLKYLNDTVRTIVTHTNIIISEFKQIHFPDDYGSNKIIRLIYNGRLLRDDLTLHSYGIDDNCVVHVHISQAQPSQNPQTGSQNADLDLSNLMWPLLSVILGIIWILYFKYPEFFNYMSLGTLFVFTGTFIVVYRQGHFFG